MTLAGDATLEVASVLAVATKLDTDSSVGTRIASKDENGLPLIVIGELLIGVASRISRFSRTSSMNSRRRSREGFFQRARDLRCRLGGGAVRTAFATIAIPWRE